MLLINKELLNNFNPSDYKEKVIDYYNKSLIMFMDDDKIEKNKKQLAQLLRDSYKLRCFEAVGIDNWSYCLETLNSKELDGESYWDYARKSDSEIIKEFIE